MTLHTSSNRVRPLHIIRAKAFCCALLLLALSSGAAGLAFVLFPGCATASDSYTSPAESRQSLQQDLYAYAIKRIEKAKKEGQLPGVEPTDKGDFFGRWTWYNSSNSRGEHRMRMTHRFADGRPAKSFDLVYIQKWELVSTSGR